MEKNFKLGITQSFPCSYLPESEERLLVAVDPRLQNSQQYAWLMTQGFRRSGNEIYRPHCSNCRACQSLRVLVERFSPSKSQKRILSRNKNFIIELSASPKTSYYPLYENYINTIHRDGSMFPANKEQYLSFLASDITQQLFIEIWDDKNLISVAVTDDIPNALSAVYTFYHPDYIKSALGVFSILKQIEIAKETKREYQYLGYQIDGCTKMNYKARYLPHEILDENQWKTVNK
jgi:arginine-tRNA-protein transferase